MVGLGIMYQVSSIKSQVLGIGYVNLSKVKFFGIDGIKYFELFKLRFTIYKIHINFAFVFGLDFSSVCACEFVFY